MSWWYYATGGEKALIVVGIVAIAFLAVILASPYIKPLQAITTKLGLVRTVTNTIYVPVNHTVYVNRTVYVNQTVVKYVYVNQTVPVYINRTIYVPVPSNTSGVVAWPINMGTCHIYSLYFPSNGTLWTLGYWLPPPQLWELIIKSNRTIFAWGVLQPVPQYGEELGGGASIDVIIPSEYPDIGGVDLPMFTVVPKQAPANWTYMIYLGDWFGVGPVVRNFMTITNESMVMIPSVINSLVSVPVLPLRNETTEVVLLIYSQNGISPFIIPCNWTVVVTSMTPQQALSLPAPMGVVIAEEAWYVYYGNYTYAPFTETWGWWVWDTEYPPQNVANLPWPLN